MRLIICLCFIGLWLMPVRAADIEFVSTAENDNFTVDAPNCNLRLTGLLAKGDADRLAQLIAAHVIDSDGMRNVFFPVLCLNSPGGSFTEAVRMIAIIDEKAIGTMIEDGAVCESACALVFMSGNYPEEGNTYPWRMMHVGARLGFHAPDLTLSAGQYNEKDVARAYRIALKTVSQTVEKLVMSSIEGQRRMAPSLLAAMLATPADQMHYVDTVDKAGRWNISVVSVGRFETLSDAALVRACANKRTWNLDESALQYGDPEYLDAKRGSDFSYETTSEGLIRILFFGMYVEGCEFGMEDGVKALKGNVVRVDGVDDIGTREFLGLAQAAHFHHPATKLAELR